MKNLITLIIGLLVLGCGKQEKAVTNESTPTTNTNKVDGTTEKPVKELTLREKLLGTYVGKKDGNTIKWVFLKNGIAELYLNGNKSDEEKWSIVNGEIHSDNSNGLISVFRFNTDKSITRIVIILDGKRSVWPKEFRIPLKKIKELTPEEQKKQKTLRDSVVGEYGQNLLGVPYKYVFLDNGIAEYYEDDIKAVEWKWSIVDGEIHLKHTAGAIAVFRINPDKSITHIASKRDGKRTDHPKKEQHTYKKIK